MTVSKLHLTGGRSLAYGLSEGTGPTVIFMGGFKSDMTGSKAMALEAFCRTKKQRFIRFDYTGHGQSSGDFHYGSIGHWKQDALDIIDRLGGDKILLVGSSMGAWLALLAALERKTQIVGLVGVASAPDFTENLIWLNTNDDQKKQLREDGMMFLPSCYGQAPYPITRTLIEEARNHLLLTGDIALDLPVRLIHGMKDEDVPWDYSVQLLQKIQSKNTQLTLVKEGNHRLSEPAQLELLCKTVENLLLGLDPASHSI